MINNYSSKWGWLVVDIYRAVKRRGKYLFSKLFATESKYFQVYYQNIAFSLYSPHIVNKMMVSRLHEIDIWMYETS